MHFQMPFALNCKRLHLEPAAVTPALLIRVQLIEKQSPWWDKLSGLECTLGHTLHSYLSCCGQEEKNPLIT